jgi:hypothetical protein
MSNRPTKFTQSDAKRFFKAAAKAGVDVRLEFRPDGTVVATTNGAVSTVATDEAKNDLDSWMKKHHANPA